MQKHASFIHLFAQTYRLNSIVNSYKHRKICSYKRYKVLSKIKLKRNLFFIPSKLNLYSNKGTKFMHDASNKITILMHQRNGLL